VEGATAQKANDQVTMTRVLPANVCRFGAASRFVKTLAIGKAVGKTGG
jgi:hypothetical protein